jgi:hypothetical protein
MSGKMMLQHISRQPKLANSLLVCRLFLSIASLSSAVRFSPGLNASSTSLIDLKGKLLVGENMKSVF